MRLLRRTVAEVLGIYLTLIEGGGRMVMAGGSVRHDAFEYLFEAYTRIRARAEEPDFIHVLEQARSLAQRAFAMSEKKGDEEAVRQLLLQSRELFWNIADEGRVSPSTT